MESTETLVAESSNKSDGHTSEDNKTKPIINFSLKIRFERDKFIRYAEPISDVKRLRFCATNKMSFSRRPAMAKMLEPDPKVFIDLDSVEPWKEGILVPEIADLTPQIIKQIKKGMVIGKLYNMSKSTLKKIFPSFVFYDEKVEDLARNLVQLGRVRKRRRYRCPLCPKEFIIYNEGHSRIYNHIEQLHTSSLVTCMKCKLSFTCEDSYVRHSLNLHKSKCIIKTFKIDKESKQRKKNSKSKKAKAKKEKVETENVKIV